MSKGIAGLRLWSDSDHDHTHGTLLTIVINAERDTGSCCHNIIINA